jgi:23S rRNA 5-hydroxycytidine C2501 synthase
MKPTIIELLSPARNLETGIAAINFGADAVYIGASKFGARAAVGNSLDDIEKLVKYAHLFRSKVFVALNTILFDNELDEVQAMIHKIYETGADALIIQDMGILEMNIPPIALHASTQCDNRTAEKVRFLEKSGFSRAVLARELSLPQIREIAENTTIELEAFIHGALCVCYSGQCYMSQYLGKRSANRGECAQPCRLPWTVKDADSRIISDQKHQLSLRDLNQSSNLEKLIEAGVSSLKIEGRLKDVNYVKNITAFYRKELDRILETDITTRKSSIGKTIFTFTPDPEKSFNRHFTNYFLTERSKHIASPDTPKSLGKYIGTAGKLFKDHFILNSEEPIHNGDGICFFDSKHELVGFRVNKVEGNKIFPHEPIEITTNTSLYRNYDHQFEKELGKIENCRSIHLRVELLENKNGLELKGNISELDESVSVNYEIEKEPAQNENLARKNIVQNLSKTAGTIFKINKVEVNTAKIYFVPLGKLNEMRRNLLDKIYRHLSETYETEKRKTSEVSESFPLQTADYRLNISNHLAEQFYKKHGVLNPQKAFETELPKGRKVVMTTKHCLKFQLGYCTKYDKKAKILSSSNLYLENKTATFLLEFDCKNCQMNIIAEP